MMSERYLPPTPPHERSALDAALPEDSAHETATPDQPADGGQTLLRGELTSGRQDPPVDIVPFPSQLVIARRHSSTRAIIRSRGREKRKRRRIPAISQPDTRVFRFDRSVAVAIHPKAECTEKQRQNERVLERRRRQTDTAPTSGRVQPKEELHKPCANFIISCRYKCYRFKPCAKDGGGSSEALVTIKEQANLQSFTFIHITPTGTDLYRRGKRSDRILGDFITITSRKCQEDTIFRSFCRLAHPEPKRAGNRRAYTRSSYRASHRRMQREEDDENFRTGGVSELFFAYQREVWMADPD